MSHAGSPFIIQQLFRDKRYKFIGVSSVILLPLTKFVIDSGQKLSAINAFFVKSETRSLRLLPCRASLQAVDRSDFQGE
jgi:hypothetical protein